MGAISRHPNADKLEMATVNGMPVIFTSGSFKEGDLAAYIPVDALVPVARKEFDWLSGNAAGFHRVKARRLRGIFSMGFITDLPTGLNVIAEGVDVQEALGVRKYVPPSEEAAERVPQHNVSRKARKSETAEHDRDAWLVGGAISLMGILLLPYWSAALFFAINMVVAALLIRINRIANQKPNVPIYDIEGLRRNMNIFQEGEEVWITEKIHGCNARYIHTGKKFHVGSRTQFRSDPGNAWDVAAKRYDLENKLAKHPGIVLFGEIFGGGLQDLNYGRDEYDFRAFDAMDVKTRRYMDPDEFVKFCETLYIPVVPTLYCGPWNKELTRHAEGVSVLPGAFHVREGMVIKPVKERTSPYLGRCFLKHVGEGYLLRKEAP